jgi:DoxX-like family
MQTKTTKTFQQTTDGRSATVARSHRDWRRIAFLVTTAVVVAELVAGSVWNLIPIDWVEAQLNHLGYPHFLAYILGGWQVLAVIVIISPRLPLLKEWAYTGAFLLWSGAVLSHWSARDGLDVWLTPLIFATFAVASWVLRPADRRLPETRLRYYRTADAGQDDAGPPEARPLAWETRPRAWVVPIALLIALYAVNLLTLPPVDDMFRDRAVENGWLEE